MTDEAPTVDPVADARRVIAIEEARLEAVRQDRIDAAAKALVALQNDLRFDLIAVTYPEPGPNGSTVVSAAFKIEPRP